jgi:lipoprotein Spr/probable lipoprotein NlpC
MEIRNQLWIVFRAIVKLLGLILQTILSLLQAGAKYVYRHRVQIMRHKLTLPAIVAISIFWTGCSVYSHVKTIDTQTVVLEEESKDSVVQLTSLPSKEYRDETLLAHINDWIGTPQRDGQNTKSGTDCSGFVQAVYQEAHDIELSRSSREMYWNDVERIKKSQLQEGDLVFFNTYGSGISHVGIYVGDGQFAHTSTKKGVTIDSMDSPYYTKHYYASGRIKK